MARVNQAIDALLPCGNLPCGNDWQDDQYKWRHLLPHSSALL